MRSRGRGATADSGARGLEGVPLASWTAAPAEPRQPAPGSGHFTPDIAPITDEDREMPRQTGPHTSMATTALSRSTADVASYI